MKVWAFNVILCVDERLYIYICMYKGFAGNLSTDIWK